MKILCTICARGGSKGLKDKNIRPLGGEPLIAHTIKQALKWGRARRVVVSTDSRKIAQIARRYGAEIPFMRPQTLAQDNIAKLDAIRHAMLESERYFKEEYDITVDLDVTSPLRRIQDLDGCLDTFTKKRPDVLFSVIAARRNPYFNMVEEKGDGFVRLCKQTPAGITRRQDAPQVYGMNASIYFYSKDFLLNENHKTPFSDRTAIYVMDEASVFDIDSETDFKVIEFLMKEGMWKDEA